MVSIYPGEIPHLSTDPLVTYLLSNPKETTVLLKDILEKIAYLHAKGLSIGFENMDKILVVKSTRGPCSILTIQKEGSPFKPQEDILAAGELFCLLWSSGSRVPDFFESDLITKMTQENTTLTTSKALHHFAFWTKNMRLGFLKKVSDILELKQKRHQDAVEAEKRLTRLFRKYTMIDDCFLQVGVW